MARGKSKVHGVSRVSSMRAADAVVVDGSQGEGGGQILRSSLSLSALSGRPLRLERIRAGRAKPGLAAQHLTAVRAVAALVDAELDGDALQSQSLSFVPRRRVRAGHYTFNVAENRKGGSAGAVALVLQSVLVPLVVSGGRSEVALLGGTHVPWSPSYDYLELAFLPTLRRLGLKARIELKRPGFYPQGGGRFQVDVEETGRLRPLQLERPGRLERVLCRTTTAGLEPHVAERMQKVVSASLAGVGVAVELEQRALEARSPGAAIVLVAESERARAAFTAIGERKKPAERVAEEATSALLAYLEAGAAVDEHLADQLLLPLAFASGPSRFTATRPTEHLRTNALVLEQFGVARVSVEERPDKTALVEVVPQSRA